MVWLPPAAASIIAAAGTSPAGPQRMPCIPCAHSWKSDVPEYGLTCDQSGVVFSGNVGRLPTCTQPTPIFNGGAGGCG